jgi:hypothetical protein
LWVDEDEYGESIRGGIFNGSITISCRREYHEVSYRSWKVVALDIIKLHKKNISGEKKFTRG